MTCDTCGREFEIKRPMQRNCGAKCALIASHKKWGRFVYPRMKRSKEEGLVGNMVQVWPKSSHGNSSVVVVKVETRTMRQKIMALKPKIEISMNDIEINL